MATMIVFAAGAGDTSIHRIVSESPDEVHSKFLEAGGLPFKLTTGKGTEVYVNPATIAYWQERGSPQVRSL
jgi:hypothetical protein